MNQLDTSHRLRVNEIEEEEEGGSSKLSSNGNGSTSGIKESAIRRETEGEFRLLGRREKSQFNGGRLLEDEHPSKRRVSFRSVDHGEASVISLRDEEEDKDGSNGVEWDDDQKEMEKSKLLKKIKGIT